VWFWQNPNKLGGANDPPPVHTHGPVAVGGVGGSGTRLVANILAEFGYFIGDDLNRASDNLWFTLLFVRPGILGASEKDFSRLVQIFVNGMMERRPFTPYQLWMMDQCAREIASRSERARRRSLVQSLRRAATNQRPAGPWGWKEPNTHVVLDRLLLSLPGMKYIHVMRNGLDMAYSDNQRQLRVWGETLLGRPMKGTPGNSVKYWTAVHKRVQAIGAGMGRNFMLLNFDELCMDTERVLDALRDFLEVDVTDAQLQNARGLIKKPSSIGRYKQHGLEEFDQGDLAYIASLGFDVSLGRP